jgi:hypothetical protein
MDFAFSSSAAPKCPLRYTTAVRFFDQNWLSNWFTTSTMAIDSGIRHLIACFLNRDQVAADWYYLPD